MRRTWVSSSSATLLPEEIAQLLRICRVALPHLWSVFADGAVLSPPRLINPRYGENNGRNAGPDQPLFDRVRDIVAL